MDEKPYSHISTIGVRLKQKWEDFSTGKRIPIVPCGFPSLLENKLFPKGKMAVLHGLSGSGKSTFAFQVAVGTALELFGKDLPGCVAVNRLEMTAEDLVERIAAILAGVDVSKWLNNTMTPEEHARLVEWADFTSVLPIFVDDTSFLTTSLMGTQILDLHAEQGPVVMLITDYGELFADDAGSEEQRMNHIFRQQFYLSREIDASVIAISQSTNNKTETGKTYIAGADGTRYSRGILQSADELVELWNPTQILDSGRLLKLDENSDLNLEHAYLFIQKFRAGSIAINGIPLGWIPERTTFFDMSISQTMGNETIFTNLDAALKKYSGW